MHAGAVGDGGVRLRFRAHTKKLPPFIARRLLRVRPRATADGITRLTSVTPPPTGYKPIFSYPVVNDYGGFLTNARQIANLRKRFEAYTGPVVNTGGVR